MTRDEVIKMAIDCLLIARPESSGIYADALVDFAELVAAAKTEECAKVCDEVAETGGDADECATEIDSQATAGLQPTAARQDARCAFLKDDMKTLEQIYANYKSETLDGRDLGRLSQFIPEADLPKMGISLKPEYVGKHEHIPFTRDAVLKQLSEDVAFGFEKALDKRGISSGLMYEVVSMWNWVLEEGLEDYDDDTGYAQYGLPLFKATAVKYGFDNPIGDDNGDEYKYSYEGD